MQTIQIHDRYLIQLLPPVDIAHHLSLNGAYYDVGEVGIARRKIIENHFSTSKINTQAFALMSVPVLSQAVEWIGRDLLGFSLLYQVLRDVLVPKLSDY